MIRFEAASRRQPPTGPFLRRGRDRISRRGRLPVPLRWQIAQRLARHAWRQLGSE